MLVDHDIAAATRAIMAEPVEFLAPRDWKDDLLRGRPRRSGEPGPVIANLANAERALGNAPEWALSFRFNELTQKVEAMQTPWGYAGPWDDTQDSRATVWLQECGINVGIEITGKAVQLVAASAAYNPIRDYLDGLEWDGDGRLDSWLTVYLGVAPSEYVAAVGARYLIQAVARVYRPGCKADSCLTLEGPQGKGKSRAARILGGEWFTDEMADIGSKDSAMQALGVWIVELAELTAVKRSEKERVKAFITRQFDRFRPPYGKHVIQVPRQCVFLATTNDFEWNNDETGARRFWPVRCGEIDLDALGRDRDQLWAEALDRYRQGAPWWLEGEDLILSATAEQCDRYDADPWQASIEEWTETKASVTMEKILADCLEKPRGTWTQSDKNRIARCLRALNWEKKRFREGKSLGWEYRRVES